VTFASPPEASPFPPTASDDPPVAHPGANAPNRTNAVNAKSAHGTTRASDPAWSSLRARSSVKRSSFQLHEPAVQVFGAMQTVPHFPQFDESVARFASHPSMSAPSQFAYPGVHATM
jgi:hypothetical protein